jgi:Rod binding domain-containing protein
MNLDHKFISASGQPLPPLGAKTSWEARQERAAKEAARLRQASQMFEAQFVKIMMGEMRRTVSKGGLIHGGFGEEMFTDVLDQERADVMVKGQGMGISRMLEAQLSQKAYTRPVQFRMNPEPVPQPSSEDGPAMNPAPAAWSTGPVFGPAQALPEEGKNSFAGPNKTASPMWQRMQTLVEQVLPAQSESLAAQDYRWPVDGDISSPFGLRRHPVLRITRLHRGIDIKAPHGEPIQATRGGKVIFAGGKGQLGQAIIVEHSDGSQAVYGHCSRLLAREGQTVLQGQSIA